MRVRIISYEEVHAWILGKFALKLQEELLKLGVDVDIDNTIDPDADINHHIIYLGYDLKKSSKCDTLMITHIDHIKKLELLKDQLSVARLGICMSKPTADELIIGGLPAKKICHINPAHDGVITPRPLTIGITSKVRPDGCKREDMLLQLSYKISPQDFRFRIMGTDWDSIIESLRQRGFEVIYQSEFDYEEYTKLIPSLDYYLYFGQDEGSMGFIDALAAGVKTIVTPQGYHLDAPNGIVHPFNTNDELGDIFKKIAEERRSLIDSVATWTWKDYAIKHLELWEHLLDPNKIIKSKYRDGLNSLNSKITTDRTRLGYILHLYMDPIRRTYTKIKKIRDFKTFKSKLRNYYQNNWKNKSR